MSKELATLSFCLIVKDEEKNLAITLVPIAALADELIVVDTGSTDATVKIAQDLGAKVFSFPWTGDFAEARNFALNQARGDWIFWLDADEYLKAEDLKKIKEILGRSPEIAYEVYIKECAFGEFESDLYYKKVKIFRNFLGIHFERPINEQVFERGGNLVHGQTLDVSLHHWGNKMALGQENFLKKKQRNIAGLMEALKKAPHDPVFRFLLGMNFKELDELFPAITYFQEAAELSQDKTLQYEALIQAAWCFFGLDLFNEVIGTAGEALRLNGGRLEARVVKAAALNMQKKFVEAAETLAEFKNFSVPEDCLAVDLTYYTYLPNYILAEAYLGLGDIKSCQPFFEAAYRAKPEESLRQKMEIIEKALNVGIEYLPAPVMVGKI